MTQPAPVIVLQFDAISVADMSVTNWMRGKSALPSWAGPVRWLRGTGRESTTLANRPIGRSVVVEIADRVEENVAPSDEVGRRRPPMGVPERVARSVVGLELRIDRLILAARLVRAVAVQYVS